MQTNHVAQFNEGTLRVLESRVNQAMGVTAFENFGDFFGGTGGRIGLNVIFFFIAGALLVLYLIYGGISLMTSQGDPKKVAGAKETITHALIGMVIVFAAYWIVQLVGIILGLQSFQRIF